MTYEEIKAAVLALPADRRLELRLAIDESFGDLPDDFPLSPEQEADLAQRLASADADPGRPWKDVRAELQEVLKDVQRDRASARDARSA